MITKKILCLTTLLIFGIIPFISAFAQPDESRGHGLEKLDQYKKLKLIEVLDLKEEQSVRFFVREKDYRAAERKLIRERVQLGTELSELIKSDAKDQDIEKKINEVMDVEQKIVNTRADFFHNLKDLLTTKQLGKLVIFEQKFLQELRRAMQDVQRERRRNHD